MPLQMTWPQTLLVAVGSLLIWSSAQSQPVRFVDPASLPKEAHISSLPVKHGEQVAVTSTAFGTRQVPAVMTVVPIPYDEAKRALTLAIEKDFGIEDRYEGTSEALTTVYKSSDERIGDLGAKRLRDNLTRLDSAGIRLTPEPATRVTTKPYNESMLGASGSRATFWVIDATEMLHCKCSLIVASRVDKTPEVVLFRHDIPIPVVARPERAVFTTREARSINGALRSQIGSELVFFPFWEQSLSANADDLVRARALVATN